VRRKNPAMFVRHVAQTGQARVRRAYA
jgi:hypothetical protein